MKKVNEFMESSVDQKNEQIFNYNIKKNKLQPVGS